MEIDSSIKTPKVGRDFIDNVNTELDEKLIDVVQEDKMGQDYDETVLKKNASINSKTSGVFDHLSGLYE